MEMTKIIKYPLQSFNSSMSSFVSSVLIITTRGLSFNEQFCSNIECYAAIKPVDFHVRKG